MAERDPLTDLHSLVGTAEDSVRPLRVEEVRARGSRRRRRRHAAVAGAVVAVALAVGGGVVLSDGVAGRDAPSVAHPGPPNGSPSASPTGVRTVTTANLPTPSDLPAPPGGGRIRIYPGSPPPLIEMSSCLPSSLADLHATALVSRSFSTVYPDGPASGPLKNAPSDVAVALQFPDAASAAAAMTTYEGWIKDCRAGRGPTRELEVLKLGQGWTRVPAPGARAEVAEVVYREPGSRSEDAYWESSGLTLLGDRLMVTVHVFYAGESTFTLDGGDDEGGFAHPQLGLVAAAADRLAR